MTPLSIFSYLSQSNNLPNRLDPGLFKSELKSKIINSSKGKKKQFLGFSTTKQTTAIPILYYEEHGGRKLVFYLEEAFQQGFPMKHSYCPSFSSSSPSSFYITREDHGR
jgi:hypothetical protein